MCVHGYTYKNIPKETNLFPKDPSSIAVTRKHAIPLVPSREAFCRKAVLPRTQACMEALTHLTQGSCLEGEMPELPCPALPRPECLGCQFWEK